MAKDVRAYRCLIISPGDVEPERDAVASVIDRWNGTVGDGLDTRIDPIRWEQHAVPDLSAEPQAIINRQLGDSCDFGIAIFWSRLGTPTASHPSGSAEEIARLLQRDARVMVYRKKAPVPQEYLKTDDYRRLQDVLERYRQSGLLGEFDAVDQLRDAFQAHVTTFVSQLVARDRAGSMPVPSSGTVTAPMPDVRVRARARMVYAVGSKAPPRSVLSITVENHSPGPFFLSCVLIELADGQALWLLRDIQGVQQTPKSIESGDSHTVECDPQEIFRKGGQQLRCAAATDKIGRTLRSDPFEFIGALNKALAY